MTNALNRARPPRVVVFTRKSKASTQGITWSLRVLSLVGLLEKRGLAIDVCELPRSAALKRKVLKERRGYDVGWIHRHIMWPNDVSALRRTSRHLVFDYDDPVCFSPNNPWNLSLSRWLKFRATLVACSGVMAATDRLVELARRYCRNVAYIPLGIGDPGEVPAPRSRHGQDTLKLLWLGSRGTYRYLEEKRPHLEAIGKSTTNAELWVVGHSDLSLRHLPVRNLPWSPQTEHEALRSCHLGLVPLPNTRWAWGKATLKPLQYMLHGMPFLGSPVGVNLRYADDGRNGFLADRPEDWARMAAIADRDEPLRLGMGTRGQRYVLQHHAGPVIADGVARFLHDVADGKATRSATA